jgi:dTDP-4-amino-4,6-dideoxygalactose transaminase
MKTGKLAIDGGSPVRKTPFPKYPFVVDEAKKAIMEVLDSGKWYRYSGSKVREFEDSFAKFMGVKYAIACNSGTAALHVALAALDIAPGVGDEVIVPTFTFISTASTVLHQGAVPIFADSNLEDGDIQLESIRKHITASTRTIIPVHLFGYPAEMDEIMQIAKEHDLSVIEDAAQGFGGEYKGRKVGTIGDINAISFCNKTIATGEGGMIFTNDAELAEKAGMIYSHGYSPRERNPAVGTDVYPSPHHRVGYNYRLSEVTAALGLGLLRHIDRFIATRRRNAEYLRKRLEEGEIEGIHPFPPKMKDYVNPVYWAYPVRMDSEKFKVSKIQFMEALKAEGIPAIAVQERNHLEELFQMKRGFGKTSWPFSSIKSTELKDLYTEHLPNVERLSKEVFELQVNQAVGIEDLDDTLTALKKVARAYIRRN